MYLKKMLQLHIASNKNRNVVGIYPARLPPTKHPNGSLYPSPKSLHLSQNKFLFVAFLFVVTNYISTRYDVSRYKFQSSQIRDMITSSDIYKRIEFQITLQNWFGPTIRKNWKVGQVLYLSFQLASFLYLLVTSENIRAEKII